jgi:hypothetical protein
MFGFIPFLLSTYAVFLSFCFADEKTGRPLLNSLVLFITASTLLDVSEQCEVGCQSEPNRSILWRGI